MKIFQNIDESGIYEIAKYIISIPDLPRIVLLKGDLGAGKTTLVKALLQVLDSNEIPSSPTFSLLNEYPLNDGGMVYHSDWYRIENVEELYDAGMEEYIFSGNLFVIEWPEKGYPLLRGETVLNIHIEHSIPGRNYTIETLVL